LAGKQKLHSEILTPGEKISCCKTNITTVNTTLSLHSDNR